MGLHLISKWRSRCILLNLIFILGLVILSAGTLLADDGSGLSLSLYGDPDYPEFQYTLSDDQAIDPIKLIIVLKNVSGQPLNMERGLSQVELSQTLELIDPCGGNYELSPEAETFAYDAPPSFRVGGRPTIPAEILSSEFAKSVTIDDLRELFPVMKRLPGAYTIRARLGSKRFVWTIDIVGKGLLGVGDHQDNWSGNIEAEEMKIFLKPASGGLIDIQVVNNEGGTPEPLFMVPVKVFKESAIPQGMDFADVWIKVEPVLSGQTDNQGRAVWGSCTACLPQDDYLALAYFQDDYHEVSISVGDSGWASGCGGLVEKTIGGGEGPEHTISDFVLFALNSIYLKSRAVVNSGNIGVKNATDGPWLNSKVEISIGSRANVKDGCQIYGDSVKIGSRASVFDVYYNELNNRGTIGGEEHTPLEFPVAREPEFEPGTPGGEDVTVKPWRTRILDPGSYGKVTVRSKGRLILSGGQYHFSDLKVGLIGAVECAGGSEIYVQDRVLFGLGAKLHPSASANIDATDIVLYVGGSNGNKGALWSIAQAVRIGLGTNIKANIYAPNGTLSIGDRAKMRGAFIARDIVVGSRASVWHESAF